ncbi:MAG TPA: universal stress protein [Thermoleophilia bacterium]|nr:universal stress protein [Thermoleophilia bacterium]
MYEQILVPLKWDSSDELVADHATSLALATGARITLLHVLHSHSRDEAAYMQQEAQRYLDEVGSRISSRGVEAATRIATDEPAEGISSSARDISADLIVMATHGHGEVRHLFLGSVTEDVIRQSEIPVLVIRPPED